MPTTGYTSYKYAYFTGQGRTRFRSYRIRFTVSVNAEIYTFDFYQFLTSMSAYYSLYKLSLLPFAFVVILYYEPLNLLEVVNVRNAVNDGGENGGNENGSGSEIADKSGEHTPLLHQQIKMSTIQNIGN